MDIASWLRELGLGQYAAAFRLNDVDAGLLASLTAEDLREMGVASVGHRRRLLEAIAERGGSAGRTKPVEGPAPASAAERRQLTVMFVDLVGSTALSARLDPEETGEILHAYRAAVAGEIGRFEGHVAKFMGDGVLAYFGWPVAHEDEAERAVRAGLAVRGVVAGLTGDGASLACRIGIATGVVMVGDLIGEGAAQESTVVGDTPNLAARLQAIAAPGQVVIAEATRRLLGAGFRLDDLGEHAMRGIDRPVPAFAVTGERAIPGRFEAKSGSYLPMVDRDGELALLHGHWAQAVAGEGQGVLLVGEAGNGKSRLVRALIDALNKEPHHTIRYQCSPYHKDSALWPVVRQLRVAADLTDVDSSAARLDKLEALLAPMRPGSDELPIIADLLGLDGAARYGTLDLTPQAWRARTMAALVDRLLVLTEDRPVLVVFEDAHWIDPTTLDLIEACLGRIERARVLIVVTSRPDDQPRLAARPHLARLTLNRLGRAGVEAIIRELGGAHLTAATIETIVARTDGVPLFVEELTKAVIESGDTAIPASLHDSLMARLDRIPEAKELAQVAACIGREFDRHLLATVAARPAAQVILGLDRLVAAELVFRRGAADDAGFAFKHALVRDAAYESQLRSRRRSVHDRIARAMVETAATREGIEPLLIARHFLAADAPGSAIPHLLRAADIAIAAAAGPEAQETIRTGLAATAELPPSDTATAWQAKFEVMMGDSLRNTHGTAAAEAGEAYRRARLAFARIGDQDGQEMALFGEYLSHFNAARLDRADEVAGLLRAAPLLGATPARHWHIHEASALTNFVRGRFAEARRHLEALPDAAGPYPDRPSAARIYLPWSLFIMGYPDRAYRLEEKALADAAGVGRKYAFAASLGNGCYLPQLGGRLELLAERATRCVELSRQAHLKIWGIIGSVFLGWLACRDGDVGRGEAMMVTALETLDAAGHHIEFAYLSSLRADILLRCGRAGEARHLLEQVLARDAATGEHWFDAELHRMLAGCSAPTAAERHLTTALAISRQQEARLWELRAARDLARLWAAQGKRQEALDLLAPVHGWFTEGFALPDLAQSKSLLAAL